MNEILEALKTESKLLGVMAEENEKLQDGSDWHKGRGTAFRKAQERLNAIIQENTQLVREQTP